jgi:hypothetical protein
MTTDHIPYKAKNLRRYRALFDGVDSHLFTAPAAMLTARDGILRIAAELEDVTRPDLTTAEAEHLERVITAAQGPGSALPPVDALLDVEAALARADRQTGLLTRALELADNRFASLVQDIGDVIIREHLRPAVEDVMAGIAKASKALPDDPSAEAILRGSDAARKAWLSLSDLAARYEAVRRSASPLRQLTPAEWDHRGDFTELHNFDELTRGLNIQVAGPRPWPTDTAGRLLYYARNGGRVWLPTVAEQDARYREVHKDALAKQEGIRARQMAAQQAFG